MGEFIWFRSPPRTRRSSVSSVGSSGGGSPQHTAHLGAPQNTAARQRSRSPAAPHDRPCTSLPYMGQTNNAFENQAFNHLSAEQYRYTNRRSVSPSPARRNTRNPSPNPQRKTSNYSSNYGQYPTTVYNNPALVPSSSLLPNPRNTNRSRSPTPKPTTLITNNLGPDTRKNLISTPEKEITSVHLFDNTAFTNTNDLSVLDSAANGSENASDNGSEVSDEGYRSLGIIQNGSAHTTPPGLNGSTKDITDRGLGLKLNRLSLNSQASTEDADMNGE